MRQPANSQNPVLQVLIQHGRVVDCAMSLLMAGCGREISNSDQEREGLSFLGALFGTDTLNTWFRVKPPEKR